MPNDIKKNLREKMETAIQAFSRNLATVRAGRANPAILDKIGLKLVKKSTIVYLDLVPNKISIFPIPISKSNNNTDLDIGMGNIDILLGTRSKYTIVDFFTNFNPILSNIYVDYY